MKTFFISLALSAFTYATSLAQLADPKGSFLGNSHVGNNFTVNTGSNKNVIDYISAGVTQNLNGVIIPVGDTIGILMGAGGNITGTTSGDSDNDTLRAAIAFVATNNTALDGEFTVEFGYNSVIEYQHSVAIAANTSGEVDVEPSDSINLRENTGAAMVYYINSGNSSLTLGNLIFRMSTQVISNTKDQLADVQYKMYPNPTTDFLQLDMGEFENEATYVSLMNTNGEEVLHQNYNNSLDVQDVPKGIYLLSVLNEENETIGTPKKVVLY